MTDAMTGGVLSSALHAAGAHVRRALQEEADSTILNVLIITSVCYGFFFLGLFMFRGRCSGAFRSPDPESGRAVLTEPDGNKPVRDMEEIWKKTFIRKVYVILGCQIFTTVVISSAMMLLGGTSLVTYIMTDGSYLMTLAFIGSILNIIALSCYQSSHPTNLVLLSSFTVLESLLVGFICAMYYVSGMGVLVIEAFAITSIVFIGLTLFTIQSKINFDFLGPFLFVAIWVLIVWSFFASFMGGVAHQIYALAGVLIFALYTVYDTHLVVNRLNYDQAVK